MNNNTETTRQQKVVRQIQRDMSDIFSREAAAVVGGAMVSVTVVRMSPDLSVAKIFVSVFPFDKGAEMVARLNENAWMIRKALGTRVKHQLRHVPELMFRLDDSLEYIDNIDSLLKQ